MKKQQKLFDRSGNSGWQFREGCGTIGVKQKKGNETMAIDIDKYRNQMGGAQKGTLSSADAVKNLKGGYVLISVLTNMPYVECEEENYNDQIHLFERKEDAESMQEDLAEDGRLVRIQELKMVEVEIPVKAEEPNGPKKKMYLNQVRQQLSTLPFLGINAICFHPAEKDACCVEMKDVLPDDFEKKVSENPLYQPNLQLTGLYLMQEARRKKEFVDRAHLQELDEEFSSNLAKSKLFLAVLPPEGKERDPKLELKECRLPYLKHQNGDNFFPVFTDVWEFQKYAKDKKNLRSIQVPFQQLHKFWIPDAKAYMINPFGFSLPISKEMLPRLLEKFGLNEVPSDTTDKT